MLILKMMSAEQKPDFGHGKGFVIAQVAADEVLRFYRDEMNNAMVQITGPDRPERSYRPGGTTYLLQGTEVLATWHGGKGKGFIKNELGDMEPFTGED